MSRFAIAACVVAIAGGCKSNKARNAEAEQAQRAAEQLGQLADRMCECHYEDPPCADKVIAAMAAWSEDARADSSADAPIARQVRAGHQARYDRCKTDAVTIRPKPARPATIEPPLRVDALIRAAREQAIARSPNAAAKSIAAQYVRSDGSLDPTHGRFDIQFWIRAAVADDDPKRSLGAPGGSAPAPAPPARTPQATFWCPANPDCWICPIWAVTADHPGWTETRNDYCKGELKLAAANCTVDQLWARAIEDGVPKDALASLEISLEGSAPQWKFSVVDEPRAVDIRKSYADDCPAIIER